MEIGCEFRGKLGGMSFTFLQVSKDGEKIGEERAHLGRCPQSADVQA